MALPVEVVRSRRRRKTVEAHVVDGVIRVSVPASMSKADEDVYVTDLVAKLERKYRSDHIDVDARARKLARSLRPATAPIGQLVAQPAVAMGVVLHRTRATSGSRLDSPNARRGSSTTSSCTSSPT